MDFVLHAHTQRHEDVVPGLGLACEVTQQQSRDQSGSSWELSGSKATAERWAPAKGGLSMQIS